MTVNRFDFAQLKATKTDEGFLIDQPIVGRVGIQVYQNADGTVTREFRPPEEVFNQDSLASFKGKPVTDGHPEKPVTARNYKDLAAGAMLSAGKEDGDFVRAELIIQDDQLIDKVMKGGKRQLSLGYKVDLDPTPGEWNGEKYDAIQRNIRVNHVAVVGAARAGAMARLNLDRADAVQLDEKESAEMTDKVMGQVRLDNGLTYEAAPEVIHALESLRSDADVLKTNLETAKKQVETLSGERDTLKARVDGFAAELDKVKADAMEAARAEVKARADLEKVAADFKIDCNGKSNREIKELAIKSLRADADLTGKSDEYVQAAFDMAVSMRVDDAMAKQRQTVNNTDGNDKQVSSSQEAYNAYMANLSKGAK